MMRRAERTRGFTMIELLVVIAIIGVLAAILLPTVTASRCRAKEVAAQAMIRQLEIALKEYESDHGRFPPDKVELGAGGDPYDNWPLVWALARPGERGTPYHSFGRDSQGTDAGGRWTGGGWGVWANGLAGQAGPPTAGNVPCFYSPLWASGPGSDDMNMYYYDENRNSEPGGPPGGETNYNPFGLDMWTGSCVVLAGTGANPQDWGGGNNAAGKNNAVINNWR